MIDCARFADDLHSFTFGQPYVPYILAATELVDEGIFAKTYVGIFLGLVDDEYVSATICAGGTAASRKTDGIQTAANRDHILQTLE